MADYTFRGIVVPAELIESLTAYVERGRPLGGFLRSVVDNDLRGACNRADEDNLSRIPALVAWLYNEAPSGCHGSTGAHDKHVRSKHHDFEAANVSTAD